MKRELIGNLVCLAALLAFIGAGGCNMSSGDNGGTNTNDNSGGNGNDNGDGGGNTNDNSGGNDNGGGDPESAIVKTNIIVSLGGHIDAGDNLVVYGVGSDEDETAPFARYNQPAGVHYFNTSDVDETTDTATMVPGSDALFSHRAFRVAGRKIALVRSTNAVSIYDVDTGELTDISPGVITLDPLPVEQDGPGHMVADYPYFATLNEVGEFASPAPVNDGREVKLIDVSGDEPAVISFVQPDLGENIEFEQVTVDADAMTVVGVASNSDIYVYDINDPEAEPTHWDLGLASESGVEVHDTTEVKLDGDFLIFLDDSGFDPRVTVMNIRTGEITPFDDNPSWTDGRVAANGGRFAYFLSREDADTGDEFNSRRSAIGGFDGIPSATLAAQLDRYDFRTTVVDLMSSAGPTFTQEDCIQTNKLIGYGATSSITPDGSRTFLAGWRAVDKSYDYIQVSTGGAFTDLPDPEGTTTTGSLMGTDITTSDTIAAFRGLRETGDGTGCIAIEDWVISFIVLDQLD